MSSEVKYEEKSPQPQLEGLSVVRDKQDLGDDEAVAIGRPPSDIPEEVRAVVPEIDNPETPCETFRAYFLGCIFAIVGTGLNTWFGARQPGAQTQIKGFRLG